MRNLSKTIVSKKVSLIDKDLTMKIIYFVIATVVMTFAANANAATDAVELFIKDVPGITDQDISLCRDSYVNGGKYFHHLGNAKLSCARNHISVDFDREE